MSNKMDDIVGTVGAVNEAKENIDTQRRGNLDIEKARLIAFRLDAKAMLLAGVGHFGTVGKYQVNAASIIEAIVAYTDGTINMEQDELLTWAINQFDYTIKKTNR